ncbi:MAG: hypothetical protein HeimC2_38250 [Candidatus Heimdallarchaeota archaeon LC_2]|nr:MAG: hypothetical protein HeimC2_38250 [Candidatus Heimdallarchaeota archaeon LC_2]
MYSEINTQKSSLKSFTKLISENKIMKLKLEYQGIKVIIAEVVLSMLILYRILYYINPSFFTFISESQMVDYLISCIDVIITGTAWNTFQKDRKLFWWLFPVLLILIIVLTVLSLVYPRL